MTRLLLLLPTLLLALPGSAPAAQAGSTVATTVAAALPANATPGTSPSSTPAGAPAAIARSAKEVDEMREVFERALDRQAAAQERSTQFIMLFVGGLFAGILAIAKLGFKNLEKARSGAVRRLEELKRELERIDAAVKKLNGDLEHCRMLEEELADAVAGAEEAKLRVQILSSDPREQLRAVEKAAASNNLRHIPFLKDVVRDRTDAPALVSEALHGLCRRAEQVAKDPEVVLLVLQASRHASPSVRHEAIQCMREIGPDIPRFQARLDERAEEELDPPLKSEARRARDMPSGRRRASGFAAE